MMNSYPDPFPRGSQSARDASSRRGLTLVELLVVITISTMLLAASVQLLRLPLQSRKTREAARQISAIVAQVKARSVEIGRPAGLLFRRGGNDIEGGAYLSTEISIVEAPPYYAGDLEYTGNAAGSAAWISAAATHASGVVVGTAPIVNAAMLSANWQAGDQIRFGNKNPWYEIINVGPAATPAGAIEVTFQHPLNPYSNPPVSGSAATPNWVAFQVAFQPGRTRVFPALTSPLELPRGIAIDLTVSGMGLDGQEFSPITANDDSDVVVMFNPQGQIDRVYYSQFGGGVTPVLPSETLFFLIGKAEQVSPTDWFAFSSTDRYRANLMDAESIWVALGHKTGKITVAENISLVERVPAAASEPLSALAESRMFARSAQDMGGR